MLLVYTTKTLEKNLLFTMAANTLNMPILSRKGHPFFQVVNFINGNINLDGMLFHDVPMLYDIVKDQLIIQDFQKVYKINLPADKIREFFLLGHLFVRLTSDSSEQVENRVL